MLPPRRISGHALSALTRLARTRPGAMALQKLFSAELNIDKLSQLPERLYGSVPLDTRPESGRPPRRAQAAPYGNSLKTPWSGSSQSLTAAFRGMAVTPTEVATRALANARSLGAESPSVGPMLAYLDESALADAAASTERYRRRASLGPLDGVPFAVKEEIGLAGLPLLGGSTLLDSKTQERDATCVARLRAAGAVLLGHTAMTEFGMNPLGCNPKRNMPRNAHSRDHTAGGSSTGSGVAVAMGIGPFAIGVDGGGSIRIPAALNGVFGIKPTWGRVSRHGALCTGSVAHIGPLASSSLDLATALSLMAGSDPPDSQTEFTPSFHKDELSSALERSPRGLRIGIDESEWNDADPEIAKRGREALAALEREGAILVPLRMELARYAAPIGYIAIGLEDLQFNLWRDRGDSLNSDLQVSYAVLSEMSAMDLCLGQRLRAGLRKEVRAVMQDVDLIALPTTATTAPRVTALEFDNGFVDSQAVDAMCRFNFLANLTGLPAVSVPVGKDRDGLPIGLQFVGDAWDEATALGASASLERMGLAEAERPRGAKSLLE